MMNWAMNLMECTLSLHTPVLTAQNHRNCDIETRQETSIESDLMSEQYDQSETNETTNHSDVQTINIGF